MTAQRKRPFLDPDSPREKRQILGKTTKNTAIGAGQCIPFMRGKNEPGRRVF